LTQTAPPFGTIYGRQPGPNLKGDYYCWNRIYDPNVGRWTSPDPANRPWGNLQDYVGSRVPSHLDATGLFTVFITGTGQHGGNKEYKEYKDLYGGTGGILSEDIVPSGETWRRFGTGSLRAWQTNSWLTDADWVHNAHLISKEICAKKALNPDEKIRIAGYSRGGALALVIAKFLTECGCCGEDPCWKQDQSDYDCNKEDCSEGCCKKVHIDYLGLVDPVSSDISGAWDDSFVPNEVPADIKNAYIYMAKNWTLGETQAMSLHLVKKAKNVTRRFYQRQHAGTEGMGTKAAKKLAADLKKDLASS
jgi:hypothetical protein